MRGRGSLASRRPQYPNSPPPQLAAVASEMGQSTKSLRDSGGHGLAGEH